ncbi:hypothetical protein [Caulobacter mirabilis]|uniref:Uncharacterized protein n=1 Tax=Caulobacter mirabilis TaxID=69666 RepID=A0A2D2AU93_9CAUL|nr:hypothetical protein [Caulobacter mirabilis]ATQ41578.1 hypothetical protein CSW64_03705 [Caulobacter mirabilis]
MIQRGIAALLGGGLAVNALFMLAKPLPWYDAVPGVPLTGAFNPHFVRDIGMAYAVVSLGLLWFAWRPRQGWPALVCAAAFLSLHAAIHVGDASCSGSFWGDLARDFPGVFLPALIATAIAVLSRPTKEA